MFIHLGAALGFAGVALGAFGAHALQGRLAPGMREVYRTATEYHLIHAVALLLTGIIAERSPSKRSATLAGWLFAAGIVLFSGSLYVLAVTNRPMLGVITPFGGLCLLAGWALLGLGRS